MRSSYSGSVIGPKMSTCTLPRIFMPAPWITRTLIIVLSVRPLWPRHGAGDRRSRPRSGHAGRARRLRARPLRWRARLALLWRPAIRLGAGTAHQHHAFTVAQAVGLAEGLDGLFVVDDCEGASPVGPPQAAFETPGVEHAGEGVPDVRERIWLAGQRAGTADLDHRVPALGEVQHLRQIGPWLRRGGRRSGLHDGQMVDDESRVGVAVDERRARVDVAPAQHVDREVVPNRGAQDPVEARVVRIAPRFFRHHDPDADRARLLLPVGDYLGNRRIIRVDRLDESEPAVMSPLHLHGLDRD